MHILILFITTPAGVTFKTIFRQGNLHALTGATPIGLHRYKQ